VERSLFFSSLPCFFACFLFFFFFFAAVRGLLGGGRKQQFAVWGCKSTPCATFAWVNKSTRGGVDVLVVRPEGKPIQTPVWRRITHYLRIFGHAKLRPEMVQKHFVLLSLLLTLSPPPPLLFFGPLTCHFDELCAIIPGAVGAFTGASVLPGTAPAFDVVPPFSSTRADLGSCELNPNPLPPSGTLTPHSHSMLILVEVRSWRWNAFRPVISWSVCVCVYGGEFFVNFTPSLRVWVSTHAGS